MFTNPKHKKIILSLILFSIITMICCFVVIYFRQNSNKVELVKVKLVSALPNISAVFDGKVKEDLEKASYNVEIIPRIGQFKESIELVAQKTAMATICCHVPYINDNLDNNQNWKNIKFIHPFYLAKFGVWRQRINDPLTKDTIVDSNKNLKILIARDPSNLRLSLYILHKLSQKYSDFGKRFKLKDAIKNEAKTNSIRYHSLKIEDFDFDQEKIQILVIEQQELASNFASQKNDECFLAINFPALMKSNEEKVEYVPDFNLEKNEFLEDEFLNTYAISLMVHKDNENHPSINIIKESLKSREVIKWHDENTNKNSYTIPLDKLEQITKNIKKISR
ncbi:hypothetical protein C6B37_01840 [Candidatus Phytoplasma phoenicium]|uniref:Uncharacterized protein n=1 Tax=Candidatus Phytoplasma phoenicium TaxID=198422 RepID=A0A2S8NTW1_9MOLU|nr:hypothetical protein C6B37_01840 [Candidatus Phytoplasma phoenicium]